MKYFAWVLVVILPGLVWAQQQTPQNPNTFGRWEIETESGMRGSVVIEYGICHYSIVSSFSSIQSNCQSIWYEGSNTLFIRPLADTRTAFARAFTTPEYLPGQNTLETQYSVGESTYSFQMTSFGGAWMKGHLLGSSEHDTVTLKRH